MLLQRIFNKFKKIFKRPYFYKAEREKEMVRFVLERLEVTLLFEGVEAAKEKYEKFKVCKYLKKYLDAFEKAARADEVLKLLFEDETSEQ